jgi:sialic acid synthase SpsE
MTPPRIELIAEVASNHGGDRGLMDAFIATYAEAGADWIKFQSYQVRTLRPDDPQRAWLAQAELSDEDHWFLKETCEKYGTKFLTTVFHASRVPFLHSLGLEAIKIGSGEAGEVELFRAACHAFPRVLLSLGAGPPDFTPPYETVGGHIRDVSLVQKLRCVSRYPADDWMCEQWPYSGNVVGWSDHCVGIHVCKRAIFKGASVIEKHVSLLNQKRERRAFEATVADFKELRAFADDDPQKYVGRWQHGD